MNSPFAALLPMLIVLLAACSAGGRQQRLAQLEELERRNLADSLMTDDSLALALADWFDSHGTPNERLRAHYILGRTYADLGETPAAVNAYQNAADCADTTAADCDWAKLSRVYAQNARLFYRLIQPQSLLEELKKAEHCAILAKDTLVAIECFSQRADAYSLMHKSDSAIYVREQAARMYREAGAERRAAIALSGTLGALLDGGDLVRTRKYMSIFEGRSGLFDAHGDIHRGREIYYYLKGRYYLATNRLDSAESMFRKLGRDGYTLNHQIATAKGLQQLYSIAKKPDSIAKYAELSYELNDSAYSLSEMENIQRTKASYNYSRNQLLAEKRKAEVQQTRFWLIVVASLAAIILLILLLVFTIVRKRQQIQLLKYKHDLEELEKTQTELLELRAREDASLSSLIAIKDEELAKLKEQLAAYREKHQQKTAMQESRLQESAIVNHLRELLKANPPEQASGDDFKVLRSLVNEVIPSFYDELNHLKPIEYDVCLLIRAHFSPAEICKLSGIKDNYISHLRQRILQKAYGVVGTAKELDERILSIH